VKTPITFHADRSVTVGNEALAENPFCRQSESLLLVLFLAVNIKFSLAQFNEKKKCGQ
jgi:hypothetical protein